MKIRNYLLAAGICLLLTGCGNNASEPDSELEAVTETTAAESTAESAVSTTEAAAETASAATTLIETTTVTTTTAAPKSYEWVKEPFLSADDINVVAAEGNVCNYGDFLEADFALILRGDQIGMVDYDGNVVMEPKYKAVRGSLGSKDAHYEFLSDPTAAGSSQVFCVKSRKFITYEEMQCPECGAFFSTCYSAIGFAYEAEQGFLGSYACDVLHDSAVGDELWLNGQIGFTRDDTETGTVVARSISLPADYMTNLSAKGNVTGGFGLVKGNQVVLPFDYTAALDYKNGIAALCKDGKWGYVNAEGTVILPFSYDADMIYSYDPNRYIPNFGEDGKDICVPYLPSEGYIALNQDDRAGYCDINGQETIAVGEFMNARPVHGGKAWVQDAATKLWGIIKLK